MKKIIGLAFAIACMLSVSMTAFAASNMNSDGLNPEDVSTNVHHVEIHAYGGTFSHKVIFENSSPEVVRTEVWGDDLPAGTFLNTKIDDITDVLRADSAEFEGWLKFRVVRNQDNTGDVYQLLTDNVYTSEQVVSSSVPNYNVAYVAKWKHISPNSYFRAVAVDFV